MKAVFTTIGVLLLLAVITVGGYLGGWWLTGENTNRQAHVDRQNYGTQLAYITKVQGTDKEVAAINLQLADPNLIIEQKVALKNQKIALINQGCAKAALITDPPTDVATFVTVYCS